ncbi:hypothetical protein [Nonomuraea jiangxiensis]|uniref:Uncharacterized protein n=1 Tax=Nonomuraea jiangxiensis TaxID=633440 RepID=A0A1G9W4W1_9ACTN|nr:hypothetical protein [Nonomuraea jiangxiensis]SDM79530.1 hypothetical protein SAMN05421869_15622 [Nonomuraea jiangxiensis]
MNRVVKAAVAVTAFGLAAALAVPAHAEVQHDTARHDGLGGGTTMGSPLGSLLGGLVGGGLLSGLVGGMKAQPSGLSQIERDLAAERSQREPGFTPNAAEDVTRTGGPLPELSPIVSGIPLGGGGLTESLPVLGGAARMAQPSVKAGKQGRAKAAAQDTTMQGATGAMLGLLDSYAINGMSEVTGGGLMLTSGTGIMEAGSATAKTVSSTARGFETLSADTVLAGLSHATRRALPQGATTELSPMVGRVAPAEMSPVIEMLPGTTQAASVDELTPLVEKGSSFVSANGTKAAGAYSDVVTALGWSTGSLTSSVRSSWIRG